MFLGSDEHPAEAVLVDDLPDFASLRPIAETRDLGWMVHEADYTDYGRLRFFRAVMKDGVIAVPPPGSPKLFG